MANDDESREIQCAAYVLDSAGDPDPDPDRSIPETLGIFADHIPHLPPRAKDVLKHLARHSGHCIRVCGGPLPAQHAKVASKPPGVQRFLRGRVETSSRVADEGDARAAADGPCKINAKTPKAAAQYAGNRTAGHTLDRGPPDLEGCRFTESSSHEDAGGS